MRDSDVETMCKYRISRSVFPWHTPFYRSVLSGTGAVPIAVPRNHSSR